MLRFLILVIIFDVLVVSAHEPPESSRFEALLQMTLESLVDCYEDDANTVKIEINGGFEALLLGRHDVPRNTKCLRYCIMRKNNLFNSENQLSTDEMLNFFGKLYINAAKGQELKEIVLRCKEKASKENDRCERAHAASMCILDGEF